MCRQANDIRLSQEGGYEYAKNKNRKKFKIGFWNIHGQNSKLLEDKFVDPEFLEICQEYDIIGFAELHADLIPSVNGTLTNLFSRVIGLMGGVSTTALF